MKRALTSPACTSLVILSVMLTSAALAGTETIAPAAGSPGISSAKIPDASPAKCLGELPPSALQSPAEAAVASVPACGAVDPSPAAHPEKFREFVQQLEQIRKANSYQFFPALIIVLNTTGDELAASTWMQKAADEGNIAAMCFLADQRLAFVGVGKEKSDEASAAYSLARKAADAGFSPAVIPVVRCLRAGIGVDKNPEAGIAYLAKACRAGDFRLRYWWLTLTDRLKTPEDQNRPEVKSEVQRGNHYVAYAISSLVTQPAERLEWMRKAADMGNDLAILELSSLLARKDPKASLTLLNEAVRRQNTSAIFTLGSLMLQEDNSLALKTDGLKRDEKIGTYMLRLAAMHGHQHAVFILGEMYLFGKYGLPRNGEHAYGIFHRGTRQGSIACAILETYCKLTGTGTAPEIEKATKALDDLLQTGHPLAALVKAYTYYKGIGCEPNPEKVMEYGLLASGSNFPAAYVHMACILAKGMPGMPPDAERAENYLRMAELNMGESARNLYNNLMQLPEWSPFCP